MSLKINSWHKILASLQYKMFSIIFSTSFYTLQKELIIIILFVAYIWLTSKRLTFMIKCRLLVARSTLVLRYEEGEIVPSG